jgi:hypothetical protein
MAIDRLTGADATLYKYTPGAAALESGTAGKGKFYKIATKASSASIFDGFTVGDLWMGDGTSAFTTGDSAYLMTETLIEDCSSFSFELNADEIEVTVLKDQVKKYRKGKSDMSGTITGINFISEMRKAGSVLNRFLKVVTGKSLHTAKPVVNDIESGDFYIKAYLNDETAVGETQAFLFGQVELFGYSLGAETANAQSWSSGVRFIGADPVIWIVDNETT